MSGKQQYHIDGLFRAEQLRSGDPYELDDGHPVGYLPSGGRHAKASLSGGLALVLRQLQRAIGEIPENDDRRIRRLDRDGLAALAEALLDFRATGDLTAWLEHYVWYRCSQRLITLNRQGFHNGLHRVRFHLLRTRSTPSP